MTDFNEDPGWQLMSDLESDSQAYSLLFERYRDYVYRLALGFCGLPLADDVVQEVFLRLGEGQIKWQAKAKFTTWLYQVCLNISREQLRKHPSATDDSKTVQSTIEFDPKWIDFNKQLKKLSGKQREAIVLRFLEGCSTRETAYIMGCSEGSVKTHLHRATKNLQQYMQSTGEIT